MKLLKMLNWGFFPLSLLFIHSINAMERTTIEKERFLFRYYNVEQFKSLPVELHEEIAKFLPSSLFYPIKVTKPEQRICLCDITSVYIDEKSDIFTGNRGQIWKNSVKLQLAVPSGGAMKAYAMHSNRCVRSDGRSVIIQELPDTRKTWDERIEFTFPLPVSHVSFVSRDMVSGISDRLLLDWSLFMYNVTEKSMSKIDLDFSPEVKSAGLQCRVIPSDEFMRGDKQAIDFFVNTINTLYKEKPQFLQDTQRIFMTPGSMLIVHSMGDQYVIRNGRIERKFEGLSNCKDESADARVIMNAVKHVVCSKDAALVATFDSFIAKNEQDIKSTHLWHATLGLPLLTIPNTGGCGALSPDAHLLATPCVTWQEGWIIDSALALQKVNPEWASITTYLEQKVTLEQALFIRFLNDLEAAGHFLPHYELEKEVATELEEVFYSFEQKAVRDYIKTKFSLEWPVEKA